MNIWHFTFAWSFLCFSKNNFTFLVQSIILDFTTLLGLDEKKKVWSFNIHFSRACLITFFCAGQYFITCLKGPLLLLVFRTGYRKNWNHLSYQRKDVGVMGGWVGLMGWLSLNLCNCCKTINVDSNGIRTKTWTWRKFCLFFISKSFQKSSQLKTLKVYCVQRFFKLLLKFGKVPFLVEKWNSKFYNSTYLSTPIFFSALSIQI